VVDAGDDPQMWRVVAHEVNKHLWIVDSIPSAWMFSVG